MSVAAQAAATGDITYEDLYRRWEQGNWSAYDLDFSEDRNGWEALSEIQQTSALWIYSMFFYGEDSVTDNLSPYIDAAPKEEQKYFLATQQVDEARHAVFFHRFFREVIGAGDSVSSTLAYTLPQLGWGYRGVFEPPRPDGRGAAQGPLAAQVRAGDRALPHGRRGDPGAARPALHRGLLRQGGDDARVQRGNGQRLARRAAPHRLRRQGALGDVRRVATSASRRWSSCCARSCPTRSPSSSRRAGTSATRPSTASRSRTSTPSGCARWRRSGARRAIRSRRCRPTSTRSTTSLPHEERARNQILLLKAGVLGEPNGRPDSSPETQRILFETDGALRERRRGQRPPVDVPVALQRRRPLAHRGRERLHPTRAGRGAESRPHLRDRLAAVDRDRDPRREARCRAILRRRLRPRGSLRGTARASPRRSRRATSPDMTATASRRNLRAAGGGRPRAARPRAARRARAASPSSPSGRSAAPPAACPSAPNPAGTEAAGLPRWFQAGVKQ